MQHICPNCQHNILPNISICPHCGEEIILPNKNTKKGNSLAIDSQNIPSPKALSHKNKPNKTNSIIENQEIPIPPKSPNLEQAHDQQEVFLTDQTSAQDVTNPQQKYANTALFFVVLGIVMIVLPSMVGIAPADGGGALLLLGFLIAPTALYVYYYFRKRYRILENMRNGKELLACFVYPQAEKETEDEQRLRTRKSRNSALFNLILIITVVICAVLLLLSGFEEDMLLTVGFMMGFMLILKILTLILPSLTHKKEKKAEAIVLISKNGVWQAGYLHTWRAWRNKLKSVRMDKSKTAIIFTYSSPSGLYMSQTLTVKVRIPQGKRQQAESVVEAFKK